MKSTKKITFSFFNFFCDITQFLSLKNFVYIYTFTPFWKKNIGKEPGVQLFSRYKKHFPAHKLKT